MNARSGKLIVFEGAEGVGKTTQIRRLGQTLTERGIRYLGVREPGGWLLLEVDARRAGLAAETVRAGGWYEEVAVHRDLTGRDRFVTARRRARAAAHAVPNVQAPAGAQPGAR